MHKLLIAEICHEANRALCEANGDMSQVPWADAENWQRESTVDGVNFVLDNPDAPVYAQHDNWVKFKLDSGWSYGSVKDAEAKTHPCLVPFEDLPVHQQAKDHVFRAIVKACTSENNAA